MKHSILRLAVLATAVLAAFSCGSKKNAVESPDTAFAEYIKAYTGGIIADDAVIRVDFTGDIEEAARQSAGLFDISPSLPGSVRWNSPSSVSYVPEEGALKVGQTYAVSIDPDKITEVSEEAL